MFTTIWEYRPAAGRADDFEAFYGASGEWTNLFRQGRGFIETVLLQGVADRSVYVTFDRWDSPEAYARFRADFHDAYVRLDEAAAALTSSERYLGSFDS